MTDQSSVNMDMPTIEVLSPITTEKSIFYGQVEDLKIISGSPMAAAGAARIASN